MVCKLRDVMGKRDERYCLIGSVELDEGFFTVELQEEEKNNSLKSPKRGRTNKAVGHLKMQIISGLGSKTITKVVKEQLEPLVELTTDDSISYIKFDKLC